MIVYLTTFKENVLSNSLSFRVKSFLQLYFFRPVSCQFNGVIVNFVYVFFTTRSFKVRTFKCMFIVLCSSTLTFANLFLNVLFPISSRFALILLIVLQMLHRRVSPLNIDFFYSIYFIWLQRHFRSFSLYFTFIAVSFPTPPSITCPTCF